MKERIAEWKRISLVTAVWRDGRVVRSHSPAEGGTPFFESKGGKEQIEKLLASLEETKVFQEPPLHTHAYYVDIRYWVMELNDGTRTLVLRSFDRHPESEHRDADFDRFCAIWKCVDAWFEQLDREEQAYGKRGHSSFSIK